MQKRTIWPITILLVIAILFSALAVADETLPPGDVTDLAGSPGESWIDWSWTNPSDIDFAYVEIYLDGTFETTTTSASYTTSNLLVDTVYTLSTRTVDTYGNTNSNWVNLSVSTTPDTTDPVISSVSLSTTTPDTGDPVVVTVHVTDNVGVTGVAAAGTTLSFQSGDTWTGIITAIEGTHSVSVIATDGAGNTDSDSSASYTATTPDTTDPVISSVSLSTTTPDTGDPVVVTVHVTDNVGVTGVTAAGTTLSFQSGDTWTGIITAIEGTHSVSVIATDGAGNTDSDSSASYTATTPDTTDPVISSVSLSTTTPDTGDPVVVTVHVTDNVGVTGVTAAGTTLSFQSGDTWTGIITAIEGTHSVSVIATDGAGNTDSDSSASYTATTPDTTDPVISSVSLSTTTPDTGDPVVVTVHVTDNVGVTGVTAAGTTLSFQSGDTWTGIITAIEGTHSVSVIATDGAVNTDSDSSASYTATTPDTTDPVISSVSLSTTTPDTGDPVVVTVHVTDNVGVTGVTAAGTTLSFQSGDTWTGIITAIEGTHSVSVIATDGAGNTDSDSSASYTATTPDVTAPSSVTDLSETSVSGSSITWEWTNPSDSDFSHTMIYLDGTFITNVNAPGNSYTATGLADSTTYQIGTRTVDTDGNINTNLVSDSATTPDVTAPSSVTDLSETSVSASSITWEWTNPSDSDFSHTLIYLDGVFITNVNAPGNSYTATGLDDSTTYQIGTRTVDTDGNINTNLVSDSATTTDVTAPSSVTGLSESSVSASSITWGWTNPSDSDFSHTMIYLDGVFITNVNAPGNSYTATGLDESTTYQIGTRTVDTDGNINTNLASDSAATLDVTAPSSVTGLSESSVSASSITWEWNNPSDSDFSHTMIYLDGVFITNVNAPGNSYTATGLSDSTTYQIGTRTVDTDGNTNSNLVSDSATTTDVTAPSSVTGLGETNVTTSSITWEWTNPSDSDFSHTIIYLDGVFITNVNAPGNSYTATGLSEFTTYQIGTRTVDTKDNINTNLASDSATTLDRSAPSSVTGLGETSVSATSITWEWNNPSDSDFSHTIIYLDGVFITNVNAPGNSYTATGLSDSTTYQIGTRTVDTKDNINTNLASDSATTTDVTAPSSVNGLKDSSFRSNSITWEWTNPSDIDFSHTIIYLDGVFITNVNAPGNSYTATGLSEFTTYQIGTRTVDTSGNINTNWVNYSATTSTSKTQSSGGGSSGGGSSSTSAEAFENIDVKDVAVMYVIKDLEKSFTFNNEGIDITYINISTDLTLGDVKTIVESLKSTSSMISTPAEGRVYKNINIWVGNEGLKSKLIISDVGFRVNRAWLEDNGVSEYSVKLSIYRSGEWYVLNTEKTDENEGYIYYETDTAGDLHSQFAIVEYIESEPVSLDSGEETVPEGSNVPEPITEEPALALEGDAGIVASESERITGLGLNMMFFAIPVLMVLILLSASYVGVTKGYHAKARNRVANFLDDIQGVEETGSEIASYSTNAEERSSQPTETIPPVQINEPHQVDIEQKLKKLEESGILSDVVHKNKK